MEHPKAIGDRTTLAVITALNALGYPILLPFGENTRYTSSSMRERVLRAFNARAAG
jgi:hypothetical protein